jgi:tRNA/tmRNA/rRNA uracil-C5-methylase (TrmA/RlmC/RlmD family)
VLDLEVGAVAHGGHCVARHGERVVFLRHALPGELVRARVTEDRGGSFCRADAIEILRPSADRVTPPCPYSGPASCGGCDFQHVEPEVQRGWKAMVVREQLTRLGGLAEPELDRLGLGPGAVAEALPGGSLGWRTRVRYAVDENGTAGLHPHRSAEVVPVQRCLLATDAVASVEVLSGRWPEVSSVEVVASSAGDTAVLVDSDVPGGARDALRGGATQRLWPDGVALLDSAGHGPARAVRGHARVRERAAERIWLVHASGFWQVHPAAADTLVTAVRQLLEPGQDDRILDLYAGVGLFAGALAPLAGPGGRVDMVESDRAACSDARRNLRDLPGVFVHSSRVDVWLRKSSPQADLVVLDPPRSGAGAEVISRVLTGQWGRSGSAPLGWRPPRRVVYVACDPASLARDVAVATALGWELSALRVLDLFPMTHHLECVALFRPPAPSRVPSKAE